MKNWLNSVSKNISPFLLLALPVFVAAILMIVFNSTEVLEEKIQLSAASQHFESFDIFKVLFHF